MTLSPGTRLGSYEIVSPLGAGGMGEVYRATDTRLERIVALKVLPEELFEDKEAAARFEREAKLLAALSHPNIAAIHAFEEISGRHFLVMELLEGTTLRDRLESRPIPPKQTVDYALQIAKGLSAAHEKGIVHRDLKPENLFVTKDGHLKILDFGLAKRTEQERTGDETSAPTESKHTEPGVVMGTLGYMSPEQVRGLPVDHRSDIFSLGAILYELLSGKKAFKRDTAADTMSAILKEEPPELSESGRKISPALDRVVRHCLEKDRSNRFQSAKDIGFALSEASGQATTSGAQTTVPASRRTKVVIAAAVVVVLAAASVFLVRRTNKTATEPAGPKRIAVLPFENLGAAEDGYFADGMTDEVRSKLAGLSGLSVIASASSGQYKATTKPPEQIAKELGVGYLLVAKVRWQKSGLANRIRVSPELVDVSGGGSPTTRWQEPFEADLSDVFKVQGEIAAKVARALNVVLSGKEHGSLESRPTSNLAAYDAYLKGKAIVESGGNPKAGLVEIEKAVALDPGFAIAWAYLSSTHSYIYWQLDPSPQEAEGARSAAERAVAMAPGAVEPAGALADYYLRVTREHAKAFKTLSDALRKKPGNAELLVHLAYAEQVLGRWEDALGHLRRARDLDPRSTGVYFVLGDILMELRRPGEAREILEQGLGLAPNNLGLFQHKVMTYLQEGDLATARAAMAAAPTEMASTTLVSYFATSQDLDWVLDGVQRDLLLRLAPGAFNDDRGNWGIVLAQAYSRLGDHAKVREHAEDARNGFAAKLAQAPEHVESRVFLGLSLAYLGRSKEAEDAGERALTSERQAWNADTSPYIQHQLVRIYVLTGEHEKALNLLEPLMKMPYYLTPGWLRIDPNFDPLRKNRRFQKLVAGK